MREVPMGERITNKFNHNKIYDKEYLFFYVIDEYISNADPDLNIKLQNLLYSFGRELGDKCDIVMAYRGDEQATFNEILSLNWNEKQRNQIDSSLPGILLIDVNFDKFDPQKNHWYYYTFREMINDKGQAEIFNISNLLKILAKIIKKNENIFVKSDEMARKRRYKHLYDSIELKPGIYGFNFDIKKGIEFLKELLNSK